MIVCYDTEFIDDGHTIELLSIGMVADDGDELYRIVQDADWGRALEWGASEEGAFDGWLYQNVIKPHLPVVPIPGDWAFDGDHQDRRFIQERWAVAAAVENFLIRHGGPDSKQLAELWADYPATDHVALYQLFGPMIECTSHGMAMRTSCLKQEETTLIRVHRIEPNLQSHPKPVQDPATEHHALHDARHNMDVARWLGVAA